MKRFRPILIALALAVVAAAGFIAFKMMQPPPDGLDVSRSKASQAGVFIVAVEPEAGSFEQGALHAWIATVTTPDGKPVENAGIAVDGGMPQHGHGLPTAPAMTAALGEGRYRIEGVKFNMGGWWVIRLTVTGEGKTDTVEFNLVV
ncbi:MAG: FixH family protein [Phyllobacteriaceae bacterium]|nr:FixH family protein [Phyllobacteriaceae bacterium]